MRHVAGSEMSTDNTQSTSSAYDEDDDVTELAIAPNSRKDRKKTGKKSVKKLKEDNEELERKLMRNTCTSLQDQRKEITAFMNKFNEIQEHHANTMTL